MCNAAAPSTKRSHDTRPRRRVRDLHNPRTSQALSSASITWRPSKPEAPVTSARGLRKILPPSSALQGGESGRHSGAPNILELDAEPVVVSNCPVDHEGNNTSEDFVASCGSVTGSEGAPRQDAVLGGADGGSHFTSASVTVETPSAAAPGAQEPGGAGAAGT